MNGKILLLQIDSLYLQSVAIKNLKWCLSGFASRKCWVWRGKTKLLMVSNKEESLQALCGNLSFSPPPPPPPIPWTFWLTGEICRNIHSLLYIQVLIVIITLGHSMWPLILLFTNEFLEVRVCTASNYKNSKLWGLALPWDSKSKSMICFQPRCGD